MLRAVEQEAGARPGDRVRAEVVGSAATRVVLLPVLLHVVRDRGGARPEVAVDRRLGVGVHVVEQREAPDECVHVRRDPLTEQGQCRCAVAAMVVTEHLVVGAVLADEEEHVLDRTAGAQRRAARCALRIGGDHLPVGELGVATDLRVGRHRQDTRAPGAQHRAPRMQEQVVVIRRVRVWAVAVRPGAESLRRDPQQTSLRRLDVGRIGERRDPADRRPRRQREDRELVGGGLRREQSPTVRRHRHRDRALPGTLRALDGHDLGHPHRVRVDHRDLIDVRDRDVRARALRIDRDALWVRQVAGDLDVLALGGARERDHRHGPRALVGDEARLPVLENRRAVWIGAGLHVPHRARVRVDDRRRVGEVERHEQRASVRRDREAVRPRLLAGRLRREALRHRSERRRRYRDRPGLACRPGPEVVVEDMDHIAAAPA